MKQQDIDKLRPGASKLRLSKGHLNLRELNRLKVVKKAFLESEQQRNAASSQTARLHKQVELTLSAVYVNCGPLMFILCCVTFRAYSMIKFITGGRLSQVIDGLEEWKSTSEWKLLSADFGGQELIRNVFGQELAAALRTLDDTRQRNAGLWTPAPDCRPLRRARSRPVRILPANEPLTNYGPRNEIVWAPSVSPSQPWAGLASNGGLRGGATSAPAVYNSDPMEVMRICCTFNTFDHRLELSPDSCSRLKITMVVNCSPEQARSLTHNKLPLPPSLQ
ncbi:unnamed protein product [Clonostachys solani]|uniref:Uncharacterized protein n=1 Tax=Clonostachys solani TaxID=160281 RepID=A0A9N9YZR1_9HYPO|nr:unnamed protein product [Clonostachys solani]